MASVRKRDPSDPSSPWVCEYTDAAGKRRRYTPKTGLKKDADAFRRKVEGEIERGEHVAASEAGTVGELCERYMRDADNRVRDGRIGAGQRESLRQLVDVHVLPRFGALKLPDLTADRLALWYRHMVDERGLSPTGARKKMRQLLQIEKFALKAGLMKTRPVQAALTELRGIPMKRIRTFSAVEVERLLDAAETKSQYGRVYTFEWMRCIVNIAAYCGLRKGEIFALSLDDIDLKGRIIHVRHSLTPLDEMKGPKTKAGKRDVPMPEKVRDLLSRWLADKFEDNERRLVFRNRTGELCGSGTFTNYIWRPLLRKAGLAGADANGDWFRFHALRHFAASWMIENGLPVTEVADILGHSTFDLTLQVYAHPVMSAKHRHAAFDRMQSNLTAMRHTRDIAA